MLHKKKTLFEVQESIPEWFQVLESELYEVILAESRILEAVERGAIDNAVQE